MYVHVSESVYGNEMLLNDCNLWKEVYVYALQIHVHKAQAQADTHAPKQLRDTPKPASLPNNTFQTIVLLFSSYDFVLFCFRPK